jgi:hypothetical protein
MGPGVTALIFPSQGPGEAAEILEVLLPGFKEGAFLHYLWTRFFSMTQ